MGFFRGLMLMLYLGVVPGMAIAQVTMEATLGLQGTVRLEKWNLVTVRLYNAGSLLHGTLGVRVWRGSELRGDLHLTNFTRAVELPHRARKRFTFAVPITSISHPVEVFLETNGGPLVQQRLDLRQALTAEQVILGLTRDLSLDFLATMFHTHTRVVYLAASDMPQHWQAYDSVSAVVLKGLSLQSLSPEQTTALQQWLARGGTLIVAGDSQYALLTEPRLQALLPVQVLGLQQHQELPVLAAHYGVSLPAVPFIAVQSRLTQGQVLVGEAAAPVLAQRPFGKGRVVFLAVDYATRPFVGWAGNTALWTEMLQPVDNVDVSRVFAELGLLDETHPILKLFSRPLLTYPSHLMLSGFLIAYCTILGIFFWRLKKRPLQSWVFWSALGLIITVMTAWAYHGLAERGLRQAALRFDLTTLEVLPDTGYMHLRGALGVFSAPGGQFTMPLQYPESILRHTFARGAGRAGQTLDVILAEPAVAIHNIVLAPWALRLFTIEGMAPAVLQVSAQRHRAGLTVQVENHSALALQGATVAYKGMLFPLGTVAPQAAILNEIYPGLHSSEDSAQRAWQALFKQRPMVADTRLAYLQEVLLQHYFGDQRLAEVSATPLLVGWLPGPTTLQQAAAASPIWGMTLVISRLSEP